MSPMIHVRTYGEADFAAVDALWRTSFPGDPPRNAAAVSIPAKLAVQPDLLLVAEAEGAVAGTVMAGWDGHRGWLYALAVAPARRRRGIGAALVREAERRLAALGCAKVNLQVRAGNEQVTGFYRRLGYAVEERISLGRTLELGDERAA